MTIFTLPGVPLTREPTCTQAIDWGASGSTLTPADTSRPSHSPGHFPDFPWSGSPWLPHGSPLHGDRFIQSHRAVALPFLSPDLPCSFLIATLRLPVPAHLIPVFHSPVSVVRPLPHPFPSPITSSHSSFRSYTPRGRQQPFGAGHWILIHPGTVWCSLHWALLSRPPYLCSCCILLPSPRL